MSSMPHSQDEKQQCQSQLTVCRIPCLLHSFLSTKKQFNCFQGYSRNQVLLDSAMLAEQDDAVKDVNDKAEDPTIKQV